MLPASTNRESHAPGIGAVNAAVTKLDLRRCHLALIEFHRAFILVNDRNLSVELLLGNCILGECSCAIEVEMSVFQQRAVAGKLSLSLNSVLEKRGVISTNASLREPSALS